MTKVRRRKEQKLTSKNSKYEILSEIQLNYYKKSNNCCHCCLQWSSMYMDREGFNYMFKLVINNFLH